MIRLWAALFVCLFAPFEAGRCAQASERPATIRLVILKIDGLNADLLYRTMRETDPQTGKSRLPWFAHIFGENGTVFENFYTRGISLSAPSWSMLDTGHHTVIRGNVEYDRFTGNVYDYLNFFPFYIGYARNQQVDMPGVEVLDRAGIPLVIDAFPPQQVFQSFQLFQREVHWVVLEHVIERRFSSKALISTIENASGPSFDELLGQQQEQDLESRLSNPEMFYLDLYTGDIDHEGHATNQSAALADALHRADGLAGRIWTGIQNSPLAAHTIFITVSDHGMNNVPGVFSEAFSLPDFFNSPAGGAHHVVTNRHQLSDFKLVGLDPLVQRVVTPSTASFYLAGQSNYPTAWLDLDGNERAAVHLRNSDLNKIHILLEQLARTDLRPALRGAVAISLTQIIERHRLSWTQTAQQLTQELGEVKQSIVQRRQQLKGKLPAWTLRQENRPEEIVLRRATEQLQSLEREHADYSTYVKHVEALLNFKPSSTKPLADKISSLVPEFVLGDNNKLRDVQHYAVGLSNAGLIVASDGALDEEQSFRCVDYFSLLAEQRVRNNPQPELSPNPIDFTATRLPDDTEITASSGPVHVYWLHGDERNQLLVFQDSAGRIMLRPVANLAADSAGAIHSAPQPWRAGFPLHLFEDSELHLPPGADRADWLSQWHTEREWLPAIHLCHYSDGVIGVTEELSPVADNIPGPPGTNPILLRFERRRRELVQADFHIFAADHWNFNARNFNPGGNHGSFFRISTHSVWMMAGAGIHTRSIADPYDSLNFASTILNLAGRPVPMPDRVVTFH